jgi:DMSO/TMAO reductase YedYZ molybdopterin-dependent catalytic subunit
MDTTPQSEAVDKDVDRRTLLCSAAAATPLVVAGTGLAAQPAGNGPVKQPPVFPGLISRQREPDNLEFPFPTLNSAITPTHSFFIRSHFRVPDIQLGQWRLHVLGEVKNPLQLTLQEIQNMPSRTVTALLECSGNSRVFVQPKPAGVLWEQGAVGTAAWTGVSLSAVLQRAGGPRPGAVEVIIEGEDSGELKEFPNPYQTPGEVHFARSLPLAKAQQQDVILAYRMNGETLTPAHGYPLRVIVPGWYGMASVKWLKRIIVADRPFQGYFQTMEYAYFERRFGLPSLVPVTELQVKSLIARPAQEEVIQAGKPFRVFGAAWTGESAITGVEVSTDAGQNWAAATLLGKATGHGWRLWEYTWNNPGQGRRILMSRARDQRGRTQPTQRDPDRRNAMISHVLPVKVFVR